MSEGFWTRVDHNAVSPPRLDSRPCKLPVIVFGLMLVAIGGNLIAQTDDPELKSVLIDPPATTFVSAIAPAAPALAHPRFRKKNNDDQISAEAVRQSISRGVQYLKSSQDQKGSWQRMRSAGDVTALATLALLNAEVDPKTPEVQAGIQHINGIRDDSLSTYFVALRIMALATADPEGEVYRRQIVRDVKWLNDRQVKKGRNAGGWSYGQARTSGADASNSQFALLALHEASRMGVKTEEENWRLSKKYWLACNDKNSGGFSYTAGGGGVRGSMTCAGISSLIIIDENLAEIDNRLKGDVADCCGNDGESKEVKKAIQWMAENFSMRGNQSSHLYYMYGMERAGRLSGRRFFGPHDWYRAGAKQLISRQQKLGGSWTSNGHGESNPDVGTSLALLFLSKGKRPVAIGKLKHGPKDDWNQHAKGVHYLTRRLEDQWKQKLNWQTVAIEKATVDDLLETPVLFISGKEQLNFSDEQKVTLKQYLENGGFVFAEACQGEGCGGTGDFDKNFRQLMIELFPESKLEPLDIGHPIWGAHYPLLPNKERPLLGLQSCCRTSVVYCPANLSCYWNLDRPATMAKVNQRLEARIEYCGQLGTNVVTYATGRQLRDKGETPKMMDATAEMLTDRVLVFPKLVHSGGADDAPNALRNMLREVQQTGLRIKMEKKMIMPNLEELGNYPFVFLHGRSGFSFTAEQKSALRTYIDVGGFVFADSICSSPQFTESFRNEMASVLGEPLKPIDANHEIWKNPRFGYVIDQVTLRTRDGNGQGGFREVRRPPELEGFHKNGKLAVIFSPNDLSCALENTAVSQCDGYTRPDAVRIGTNVILYSLLSDIGK